MTLLLLLTLGLFAPAPEGTAQGAAGASDEQLDVVTAALRSGDAEAVASYFDATVELVLPGVDNILPRETARARLAAFLAAHPPRGYARVHGGTSSGEDGAYVIGTLRCEGDAAYRVYVYGRVGERPVVQELRIERE